MITANANIKRHSHKKQYDLYDFLGLDKNASDQEIRQAYRKLAKHFHPDLHPGDSRKAAIFKRIVQAYEILSNPKKRGLYDRMIDTSLLNRAIVWFKQPFSEDLYHDVARRAS